MTIIKYPRTRHLFGPLGDKHMGMTTSAWFLNDPSLIIEEKLDGTNVGIQFDQEGNLILQSRGSEITEGMHPQFNLLKQWAATKRQVLEQRLGSRYVMFGEWLYAHHCIEYFKLPHYFFEFDIYDKEAGVFLSLEKRLTIIRDAGIMTVPVVHRGPIAHAELQELIQPSLYDSQFENPETKQIDNLAEGLYLRTEGPGQVTGRAKFVRPEFIDKLKISEHWKDRRMKPNTLASNANIWE